jgi:hypothetical protein
MVRSNAVRLRAHPNVISLADERRAREQRAAARLQLVGWRVPPDMLTPEEIAALRRRAKENAAYFREAFAHLRPSPPPPPSHPAAQALLAGIMQGVGERAKDEAMAEAGKRLAEVAQKGPPAAPGKR